LACLASQRYSLVMPKTAGATVRNEGGSCVDIIKHLSEHIGPRVAGTDGEYRASLYLASAFKKLGLDTRVQRFSFLNWVLNDRPRLTVLEPEEFTVETAPMAYTLPTTPQGITGTLKKAGKKYIIPGYMEWEKYEIIDETGRELGFLVVNPGGPAVPIPNNAHLLPEIGAIIGKEDSEKFASWMDKGLRISVRLWNPGNFTPSQSQNIIGVLGAGEPEIIVCAHYDSVFYSPGAVDNASGVQVIYNIAKRLKAENNANLSTIGFIAMGCEEPALLGSRHFVKHLKEHGLLETIRFCVNFDMVGRGERYVLRAGQGTGEYLLNILQESGIEIDRELKLDTAKASSDNWPFNEEGIANVQLLSLPFPLYHQAEDTLERVDPSITDGIEEIGYQLVRAIALK